MNKFCMSIIAKLTASSIHSKVRSLQKDTKGTLVDISLNKSWKVELQSYKNYQYPWFQNKIKKLYKRIKKH